MAITCPRCGAEYDVTLFQYEHCVRCRCGEWVNLEHGHVLANSGDETGMRVVENVPKDDASSEITEE